MKKIYIDEAGNTGADIMIKNQPVFVLAGVMLDEQKEHIVLQKMETIFQMHREQEELEIKGKSWSRSAKKASALQAIIEEIFAQKGDIAIVIVEKRFMAGAMVVDNFFDYVYNDVQDLKWVNCRETKIQGANYYYEHLTDELAFKVWNLFKEKQSPKDFRLIIDELLLVTDDNEYKVLLEGAKPHVEDLVNDLYKQSSVNTPLKNIPTKVMRAPNFSTFNQLINMFIPLCRASNSTTKLIIDEQHQFEESYIRLFDIFCNIKIPAIQLGPNFEDVIYSWNNVVTDLSIGNSQEEKGLQLADIVASSINSLMLKAQKGDMNKFLELDLFNVLLLQILGEISHTVHYVVSNQFYKKYLETVKYLSMQVDIRAKSKLLKR